MKTFEEIQGEAEWHGYDPAQVKTLKESKASFYKLKLEWTKKYWEVFEEIQEMEHRRFVLDHPEIAKVCHESNAAKEESSRLRRKAEEMAKSADVKIPRYFLD